MEFCVFAKKNLVVTFRGRCVELEITMLGPISQVQEDEYHSFSHV